MSFTGIRGPSRIPNKGKFTHIHRPGIESRGEHEYEGYRYRIGHTRVGVTRRRDLFSVDILDEEGRSLNYLSGMATAMQSHRAAQSWIDRAVAARKIRIDQSHREDAAKSVRKSN